MTATDNAKYRRLRYAGFNHGAAVALSALDPSPDLGAAAAERQQLVQATEVLGPGQSASLLLTLAPGYRLLQIGTDRDARVRLYSTVAGRDADLARPVATEPASGSGLQLEYVTLAASGTQDINPLVDGYTAGGANGVAASITNNDTGAGAVTLTLLWLRTEGSA